MIKITEKKLLIVEGKDEEVFLKILLEKKGILGIQITGIGGKQKFTKELLKAIKNAPDFNKVETLAVIQDADESPTRTFERIQDILKECDMNPPKKINSFYNSDNLKAGIFVIPDGKSKGNLEALCLSTVESEDMKECIESFMKCMNKVLKEKPKNKHKAYCKAFLSAKEEDVPSLGIATKKGYWNLDSDSLEPLTQFLKKM